MSESASASSTPLSDEDNYYLSWIGQNLVQDTVSLICEGIFWTVYLVLFTFAMRIQLRRGLRTTAAVIMFAVTCLLFASSTSLWAMNFVSFFIRLRHLLIYHPDLGLLDRIYDTNHHIEPYGLPMETLFLLNMIIGDAVVIWRAWVLWKGSHLQKLVFVPMIMLLASFIFSIIALTCLATQSFGSRSTIPGGSKTCQWGEPIAWAISLLTNITSTTLIAVKAWQHRQFLKSGLGRLRQRSKSEKILLLLVESGFIYCFFWLSQLILFFDIPINSNVSYLYMVLSTMGDQISGVYPTAIIVLVNMQRSMADDSKASMHIDSGSNRTPRSQELSTMQFNATPRVKSLSFPSDTTQPSTMTFASPSMAESSIVSRYQEDV